MVDRHAEVGVDGELSDDQIGRARVEVDGLGTDQDDRIELRRSRLGSVEQRGPSADVLLIEFEHAELLACLRADIDGALARQIRELPPPTP